MSLARLGGLLLLGLLVAGCPEKKEDQKTTNRPKVNTKLLTSARSKVTKDLSQGATPMVGWPAISTPRDADEWPTAGRYERTLEHAGNKRRYLVQLPTNFDETKPTPVFFMLHGGGGTPEGYIRKDLGVSVGAAAAGYIAVFPEGIIEHQSKKGFRWGHGLCQPDVEKDPDDAGFLGKILDELGLIAAIDERRIYVMGFSSGGRMAHRVGAEMGDKVAAIVAVGASASCEYKGEKAAIAPKQPVSVLLIHGTKDEPIPHLGGPKKDHPEMVLGSFADATKLWTSAMECGEPKKQGQGERYSCKDGHEVGAMLIDGLDHRIPEKIGDKPAMAVITRFLSSHRR